jgi:hypothetical protein
MSLRAVAAEMAAQGFLNERGRPFNPKSVAVMLAARTLMKYPDRVALVPNDPHMSVEEAPPEPDFAVPDTNTHRETRLPGGRICEPHPLQAPT